MKIKQRTKFSLIHYKEIAQKFVAMTVILAFTLTICVVPSKGAKTKSSKKRNTSANRSVKPLQQPRKALNDPNLDTITVTNHNVGNFKKGFAGDAVSSVSSCPFYKLDVVGKVGTFGITNILGGSTVNGSGQVVFAGQNAAGYAFYRASTTNIPTVIA